MNIPTLGAYAMAGCSHAPDALFYTCIADIAEAARRDGRGAAGLRATAASHEARAEAAQHAHEWVTARECRRWASEERAAAAMLVGEED